MENNLVIWQCDQMARLFLIIWLLTTTQICPKFIKFAKVSSKFCQTKNKLSKVCTIFLKVFPSVKICQIRSHCLQLTYNHFIVTLWQKLAFTIPATWSALFSVTRLGNFLHFGQLFKAFGNNYFTQIAHIVEQIL